MIIEAKQGIHRHQTPPRYRNAASGSRLKVQPSAHRHTAHYGQTYRNAARGRPSHGHSGSAQQIN